jgi:SAM-dependent methyltransferase
MAISWPLAKFLENASESQSGEWPMKTTTTDTAKYDGADWFESWFDSAHYHRLYAYRDNTEAAEFIDQLVSRLCPCQGTKALDLGCGAGRHSRELAARGFDVVGLDLSAHSIERAKFAENAKLHFRRHDMRVPFGIERFDYVFNLFTSFGYFESADENRLVLDNVSASLKSGGQFVLDYLNVEYAEAHSMKDEVQAMGDNIYYLTRWSDATHFFKRITIHDLRGGEPLEYQERVAKLTLQDFSRMLAADGLTIDEVFGDYGLHRYDVERSPRMIVVASKGRRPARMFRPDDRRTMAA